MLETNHNGLKEVLERSYETKIPAYIWGATGIGKSSSVKQLSRKLADKKELEFVDYSVNSDVLNDRDKFVLIDQRLSQMDATDIRGIPDMNGEKTDFKPPAWLPDRGSGIIFLDELNLAPPTVQSAAYELILDRKVGEYRLPDGYNIIAAGNRIKDKANINTMPKPLQNRFIHIELQEPNIDEWIEWAFKNEIDHRIISFLKFEAQYLYDFVESKEQKVFPTPRAWEYASKLIKGIEDKDRVKQLLTSVVGFGIATEFTSFIELDEEYDVRDVLNNPKTAELPDDTQELYSMCYGIVEATENTMDDLEQITKLAARLSDENNTREKEIGALMLKMYKKKYPDTFDMIDEVSCWNKIIENIGVLWL